PGLQNPALPNSRRSTRPSTVSRRFSSPTEPNGSPHRRLSKQAPAGLQPRRERVAMATYTDIARRVYNHTFKLDPIVRSLLDTDFYKLLMLQMIWGLYPRVEATFSLINRTRSVRLAEEIDIDELRA